MRPSDWRPSFCFLFHHGYGKTRPTRRHTRTGTDCWLFSTSNFHHNEAVVSRREITLASLGAALGLHQTTFAMGEAVAHLHALWFQGRLRRTLDAEGVYRFQPA
jgi:hypothetical protein